MDTLEEVYSALRGQGELEWIGQGRAAVLYFNNGKRRYKIFFDDSNVEISEKKRFFKQEYWESLGSRHYCNPEDSIEDVYDTVMYCLRTWKYGEREGEA
ncbi:hypothetical protein D7X94_06460 [Acutalibacter sp. 1XD8-33]|uniref:hypothetical protein n=1 Tax=Acutalibacter sp. 1XD8-33 TaxID=2320081 RepID=UPI000EA07A43|nr:hypothetical protein [Acutalibacter sp. 1XD8-33]RKJ40701.1 hypothetical protein D7X94_06460 [Acutalibacter sp. 1XD8-33]